MKPDICPTITTDDQNVFRVQIEKVARFAMRLHIDVSDGVFTPNKLINIEDIWWPGGVRADLHIMYKQPFDHIEDYLALGPQLVIVHAEAEGNFLEFADAMHEHGIEAGIALLPETTVETIQPALEHIDHVLIFSGNLGHFGGHADLGLLAKVHRLKELKPQLEIGWDGGINDRNARDLAKAGVDVLNAGGFLHGAEDPNKSYYLLKTAIEGALHAA